MTRIGARKGTEGYLLLDVLLGLFLLSLGFSVLYGMTQASFTQTRQSITYSEAANLAQSVLDELSAHAWTENLDSGKVSPGEAITHKQGRFNWVIWSAWDDMPGLLHIKVEVSWWEAGNRESFVLETVYDTNE